MKKNNFQSFIITLLTFLTLFFSSYQENLLALNFSPKLIFLDDHFHYDKSTMDQEMICNFRFINKGTTKLVIYSVKVLDTEAKSIECKIAGNKMEYGSDETGEIIVTFNSKEFIELENILILVESNDAEYPNYIIPIFFETIK